MQEKTIDTLTEKDHTVEKKESILMYSLSLAVCVIPTIIYFVLIYLSSATSNFALGLNSIIEISGDQALSSSVIYITYLLCMGLIGTMFCLCYILILTFPLMTAISGKIFNIKKNKAGFWTSLICAFIYIIFELGSKVMIISNALIPNTIPLLSSSTISDLVSFLLGISIIAIIFIVIASIPDIVIAIGIFFAALMISRMINICNHKKSLSVLSNTKNPAEKYLFGGALCAFPIVMFWAFVYIYNIFSNSLLQILYQAAPEKYTYDYLGNPLYAGKDLTTYNMVNDFSVGALNVIAVVFAVFYLLLMLLPLIFAITSKTFSLRELLISFGCAWTYGVLAFGKNTINFLSNLMLVIITEAEYSPYGSIVEDMLSDRISGLFNIFIRSLPEIAITLGVFFLVLMMSKYIKSKIHNKAIITELEIAQ